VRGFNGRYPLGPLVCCLAIVPVVVRDRKAGRVPGRADLAELRRRLEAPWRAEFLLRLRCGHCPNQRVLDELVVSHTPSRGTYSLTTNLPTSKRRGSRLPVGEVSVEGKVGGITRPSITRAQGPFGRPESRPDGHDVWMYECHARCGATHTFTEARLLAAFLEAFTEGRAELVAGVDL
jgi:hypothetical protein